MRPGRFFSCWNPVEAVGGQVFNVGSDEQNIRILDLAKQVARRAGGNSRWSGTEIRSPFLHGLLRKNPGAPRLRSGAYFADGAGEIFTALEEGCYDTGERTKPCWYRKLLEPNHCDAVSHTGGDSVKVAVVGASGQVGSLLCRVLTKTPRFPACLSPCRRGCDQSGGIAAAVPRASPLRGGQHRRLS
jgi:hypothetical protein